MSSWIDTYKDSLVTQTKTVTSRSIASNKTTVKAPPAFNEDFHRQLKDNKLRGTAGESTSKKSVKNYDLEALKRKRAFDVAISPAKNIPVNLIMMYMSPNSLQMIPIMMTLMLFINSVKEIFQVEEKFKNVEISNDYDKVTIKALYVVCCCGNLAIGLWKLNGMGLIPNRSGDWISWEPTLLGAENSFV
ncbi:hypothetical protein CANARDRAFT_26502 [[Candida] arabinofermentans NRRL YB-2248]|uniref:ER membrane protein complex subunit 4 n=1 Tax=[Candida] arabinofermentans NRRL YB-2248 TaxID=983967 RepID=A0A1E4T5N5_9ASCO|nr:hypothetical protein CANARDRAFT_26502 [[Candida] arabinofermentans NRRL YB-2248]